MKLNKFMLLCAYCACLVLVGSAQKNSDGDSSRAGSSRQARVMPSLLFPFFKQYQDIDLGTNLNRLKSSNTVAFFIVRDALTYMAEFTFWWTMHALFWDGRISRDGDVPLPIQIFSKIFNTGMDVQRNIQREILEGIGVGGEIETADATEAILKKVLLEDEDEKTIDTEGGDDLKKEDDAKNEDVPDPSSKIIDTIDEVSFNGLFNFFGNPDPNFRNLVMNTGFVFFQLILWMAPTFMWTGEPLPTPATPKLGEETDDTAYIENRIGPLVTNLGQSSAAAIYNRLLCPQCIAQNLSVFALIFSGKILFWWWLSSLPDFNSFFLRPILGIKRSEDDPLASKEGDSDVGEDESSALSLLSQPLRARLDGALGDVLTGAILGGSVGAAAYGAYTDMKNKRKKSEDKMRTPKRRRGRKMDLSFSFRDIMDGVMTDFLAMAEIRSVLVAKGIISEEE